MVFLKSRRTLLVHWSKARTYGFGLCFVLISIIIRAALAAGVLHVPQFELFQIIAT